MALNIGLIGLGRHGLRYANHLLEPLPGMALVAVCRRQVAAGRTFASDHGLRFHQDYRDLIADPLVQAVVVVTPPSETHAIALAAIDARKPILIEKPLAGSAKAAAEMVEVAETARVPLMTAQTLRFDATIAALKARLHTVGPLRYGTLTLRLESHGKSIPAARHGEENGLGVLMEIGVHCFDLIRYLTGEEIGELHCDGPRVGTDGESMAFVTMMTAGTRSPFIVDVSRVSATRMGRIEWIGKEGQLIADWSQATLTRLVSGEAIERQAIAAQPTIVAALRAFIAAVEEGRPMPITGRDGQKAIELVEACYESAASRRNVRLIH